MNKILDILRTPGAMLVALVLALVAQLEHTARVFSMVIGAQGVWSQVHAYAFAIAVETAVLLFVLAGHRWISYGFAVATAATNLSYYAMHGVDLLSVAAIPAWLMSLLLPAAIVGYSHTIAESWPAQAHEPENATPDETPETVVETPEAPVTIVAVPTHQNDAIDAPEPSYGEQMDARTRALLLARDNTMTSAEIARMVGAKDSTVRSWLRRAQAATNGA